MHRKIRELEATHRHLKITVDTFCKEIYLEFGMFQNQIHELDKLISNGDIQIEDDRPEQKEN